MKTEYGENAKEGMRAGGKEEIVRFVSQQRRRGAGGEWREGRGEQQTLTGMSLPTDREEPSQRNTLDKRGQQGNRSKRTGELLEQRPDAVTDLLRRSAVAALRVTKKDSQREREERGREGRRTLPNLPRTMSTPLSRLCDTVEWSVTFKGDVACRKKGEKAGGKKWETHASICPVLCPAVVGLPAVV
jgi:hypothetical protein